MRKAIPLTAFALISAMAPDVSAQGAESSESVLVTARRLEEEIPQLLAQSGTRITTITAPEIRNGGYLDVAQALNSVTPGLYVSPKNGPFDYVDISFQGSRTADVLWLVDGIRVNNRLYAFTTPLDTLPASMVERIETIEGGQALFYGTQAAAGAINIVTKDFSDIQDGALKVGGDTNGGVHVDGYVRDIFGRHRFVVYASYDRADGITPFPDADFQPSATQRERSYSVATFGGKYRYDFSEALRLTASYQHTLGKVDFALPQDLAVGFNDRDEDLASLKLDYTLSDRVQFFVKGYYHRWQSFYTELDNDLSNPAIPIVVSDHDQWGFQDYGLNALGKVSVMPGLDAIAGYDFQSYEGSDAVLVIENQTERVHAVFGQLRTTPDWVSGLHLSVGVRHNAPSFGESATVWNVGGQYELSEKLFARASLGSAFRLPTAEELFANDPGFERGNPDLKPEESRNANVSLGGTAGTDDLLLKWEVIGFYREIENLIDYDAFDAAAGQDVFGNVPGTVTQKGLEFALDAKIGPDASAGISYTLTQSRSSGSSLQLNRVPVDLFKAKFDWQPEASWFGAGATLNYVGDVFDTIGGGVGRRDYGNYAVVDLNARIFVAETRRHRIDFHLKNIFDEAYTSRLGRGTRDSDRSSYLVRNLGLPRTLLVNYTYALN